MSMYDAYRSRVNPNNSATPLQDAILGTTKRQQTNLIMNSPSLSYVNLNDELSPYPAIVSDIDTFHKRRILFVPDSDVNVGDYVVINEDTYLAVDMKKSDIYPELFADLCTDTYKLVVGLIEIQTGTDDFGRPLYDNIEETVDIPCVLITKNYSVAENTVISLPDGNAIAKFPYREDWVVEVNDKLELRNNTYEVRSISYDNVYNKKGFIEVQLQREVN